MRAVSSLRFGAKEENRFSPRAEGGSVLPLFKICSNPPGPFLKFISTFSLTMASS